MTSLDIEDLCRLACSKHTTPGTPGARLSVINRHVAQQQKSRCAVCPSATATQATAPQEAEQKENLVPAANWQADFPVVNPYGPNFNIDQLKLIRETEKLPRMELIEKMKRREIKPPTEAEALVLLGEEAGQWPYPPRLPGVDVPAWTKSPEVASWANPVLRRYVENVKGKKTDMSTDPLVVNGYDTYGDPARFEAEVQALFREDVLIAGLSCDLQRPHAYLRLDVVGKSILLTRDAQGTFRAFENVCRHRGMELVGPEQSRGHQKLFVCPYHSWSYSSDGKLTSVPCEEGFDKCEAVDLDSRNLIELPAREKCGILFIVPGPKEGQPDIDTLLAQSLHGDLVKELESIQFGQFHRLVEQRLRVNANWKLGMDTFGESYHFSTVHPFLRERFVPGCSVAQTYGEAPRNSRMTLGRVTTRMMADGKVPESRWAEPCALDHMLMVYHMMPNVVILAGTNAISVNHFWPVAPNVFDVTIVQYYHYVPETPEQKFSVQAGFSGLLDVVATEDFPLLPRMQMNLENNRHAEFIFGRNEPCLSNMHKYYAKAVEGRC